MEMKYLFISCSLFVASTAAVLLSASFSFSVFLRFLYPLDLRFSSFLILIIMFLQYSGFVLFSFVYFCLGFLSFFFVLLCRAVSCSAVPCLILSCPNIIILAFFLSIQCGRRVEHSGDALSSNPLHVIITISTTVSFILMTHP